MPSEVQNGRWRPLASATASNGLETRLYIQQFMIATRGKECKGEERGGSTRRDLGRWNEGHHPRQTLITRCQWETAVLQEQMGRRRPQSNVLLMGANHHFGSTVFSLCLTLNHDNKRRKQDRWKIHGPMKSHFFGGVRMRGSLEGNFIKTQTKTKGSFKVRLKFPSSKSARIITHCLYPW